MPTNPSDAILAEKAPFRGRDDACPGSLRLHSADDGALARVRIPGGELTTDQADTLADAALGLGDGDLHLTSRGNVQLRGLGGACGGELARLLGRSGLLPSPAHERMRNIVASPLAGLDRPADRSRTDTGDWPARLDALLCGSERAAALSGRFLFAVDDGRGDVDALGADLTLLARDRGTAALRVGGTPTLVLLPAADAPRAALLAAETFLSAAADFSAAAEGAGAWRVADLPHSGAGLPDAVLAALRSAGITVLGTVDHPRPAEVSPPAHGVLGGADPAGERAGAPGAARGADAIGPVPPSPAVADGGAVRPSADAAGAGGSDETEAAGPVSPLSAAADGGSVRSSAGAAVPGTDGEGAGAPGAVTPPPAGAGGPVRFPDETGAARSVSPLPAAADGGPVRSPADAAGAHGDGPGVPAGADTAGAGADGGVPSAPESVPVRSPHAAGPVPPAPSTGDGGPAYAAGTPAPARPPHGAGAARPVSPLPGPADPDSGPAHPPADTGGTTTTPRTPEPPTRVALSVGVPLGRITPGQWRILTDTARRYGNGRLRLTPWRGVIIPGLAPGEADGRLAALAAAGLITGPESPWTGVGACIGRPGCAKSLADVRAAARETGPAAAPPPGTAALPVYWSGCERRCGHPHGEWTDVLAVPGGYRVTRVRVTGTVTGTALLDDPAELADAVRTARRPQG